MMIQFEFTARFEMPREKDLMYDFLRETSKKPFMITSINKYGQETFIKVRHQNIISDEHRDEKAEPRWLAGCWGRL